MLSNPRREWLTDAAVTGQLQELEMIRQKVYQLEQAQIKMKQEYVPSLEYAKYSRLLTTALY